MTHKLIELPYGADALAPVISAETIAYHHGKHLKGYVDTLNKLIAGTEFENMTLGEIVKKAEGKMYNQAGQVLNHNLYFLQFCGERAEANHPVSWRKPLIRSGVASNSSNKL